MSNSIFTKIVGDPSSGGIYYIIDRLKFLSKILIISFIFNYVWNYFSNTYFDGANEMSLFESTIIWLCIY